MNSLGLVFWALWVLITLAASFFTSYTEENTCDMSYSYPKPIKLNLTSSIPRLNTRYDTYIYKDQMYHENWEDPTELGGTPVVFIPGNAGSFSQGRSMASMAAKFTHEQGSDKKFDFFLIHFDEDFSALSGKTLTDQATYVNDMIYQILVLYSGRPNAPKSVTLICHSMGGLVARLLVTLDNYVPHSVNTIFTLSTPHLVPPLTMDRGVTEVYDKVNQFWRQSFKRSDDTRLDEMALVSISGGHTDNLVPPEYTPTYSVVPTTHGISAYSYAIPEVWRGQDHLCIVWCNQLLQVLVKSLFAVADPNRPQRTIPRGDRVKVFEHYYKSPLDDAKLINRQNALVWNAEEGSFATPIGPMAIVPRSDPVEGKIPFNYTDQGYVSTFSLLVGIEIDMKSKFLDIPLPSLHSSLLALNVRVETTKKETVAVRHWVPSTGESRWYDANNDSTIYWYSASPFVPYPATTFDCLHIQVIALEHNNDSDALKVYIDVDIWASLANFAIRYRTVVFCFPTGVVLLVLLIQLHAFNNRKHISFKEALGIFVQDYFVVAIIGAMVVQFLLYFGPVRYIVRSLQVPSERANIAALKTSRFDIIDLFTGITEPLLIFIPALLLVISTALVVAVEYFFYLLVTYSLAPIREYKRQAGQPVEPSQQIEMLLGIGALIALCVVPHQCVYVAAVLYQIYCTVDVRSWKYSATILLFWTALVDVPTFAVWYRDFQFKPNLDFRNLLNIASSAPSVLLVLWINSASFPINIKSDPLQGYVKVLSYAFIAYTAYYAFMHGFMHTFMMHYFANFLAGWMIFIASNDEEEPSKKSL